MVVPPNLTRERRRVAQVSVAVQALEGVGHVDKDSKPVLVETRLLPPLVAARIWPVRRKARARTKKLNRDVTCEAAVSSQGVGLSDSSGLRSAIREAPRGTLTERSDDLRKEETLTKSAGPRGGRKRRHCLTNGVGTQLKNLGRKHFPCDIGPCHVFGHGTRMKPTTALEKEIGGSFAGAAQTRRSTPSRTRCDHRGSADPKPLDEGRYPCDEPPNDRLARAPEADVPVGDGGCESRNEAALPGPGRDRTSALRSANQVSTLQEAPSSKRRSMTATGGGGGR